MEGVQTNLLSLPMELLRRVVGQLINPNIPPLNWDIHLYWHSLRTNNAIQGRDIYNLRLVNSTLSNAASHALVPVLSIQLSQASLTRAANLISNPLIAAGIRWIEVGHGHFPENFANDWPEIFEFQVYQLSRHLFEIKRTFEALEYSLN